VASVATTVLSRWPHRRVLLAVLVVSLVLNVCFIAGVAWTRIKAPPVGAYEAFLQRVPSEVQLDDKQRAAFDRYVAAIRGRYERMRQQVAPLYASAWEEMAKPQANSGDVVRLFDEVGVKRQESQREGITQTLEFMSTLSPDQRRKFVTLMRERLGSRRGR
jgi:uncharacterized membrane protein